MESKQKIVLIMLLALFIVLAICMRFQLTDTIDNNIYSAIQNIQNESLTAVLISITNLGGISKLFFIMLITVIILLLLKKRKWAISIVANLMLSSIAYISLKYLIQRPRPDRIDSLIDEIGYSFPSGHTTNNTAFYTFAIYLIYKNVKNKKLRTFLCILLGIIPVIIGFSRIYLRVHYFTDVLAGFCLGIICVIIFISFIYNKIPNG